MRRESVWLVSAGSSEILLLAAISRTVIRSAGGTMRILCIPANDAAVHVNRVLRPLVMNKEVESITWSGDKAVVLSNWTTLHGRGPQPPDEGVRVVERLYVR